MVILILRRILVLVVTNRISFVLKSEILIFSWSL